MRIVNYDEFIKLPAGTVFAETEPDWMGHIKIKEDSLKYEHGSDFYEIEFTGIYDGDYNKMENGEEVPLDLVMARDGMFDYDRKFIVFSKEDIQEIIAEFKGAIVKAY